MPKQKTTESVHQPVLSQEVLKYLSPEKGESYLDVTAGRGGHAAMVINATGAPEKTVLVDRDADAIAALDEKFRGKGVRLERSDFLSALRKLESENQRFDMILADLGVSSPHFEEADRGFSFSRPGPLDMRMDRRQELKADDIVNRASRDELAVILSKYGEEPRARSIAGAIANDRPIKDTGQLAETIAKAAGYRGHSRIHPATKAFQAIRIAVNDELAQLEQALPLMTRVLAPEGRLVVISFHSLEDKLVKNFFAGHTAAAYDAELSVLTRRPVTASPNEIASNPRARSAKLRAAAKIKTNRKD